MGRGMFGFRPQGPELPRHVGVPQRGQAGYLGDGTLDAFFLPRALTLQPGVVSQECPPPFEWPESWG